MLRFPRFRRSNYTPSPASRRATPARKSGKLAYDNLEARCLLATVFYQSPDQIVTIDSVIGDFSGATYADDPTIIDTSAVLEDPNNPDPPDYDGPVRAVKDKLGNTLYPVDSTFGFYVTDFLGAEPKVRDGLYTEGWVGNIVDEMGQVIGISIANAETDTFKSGSPLGTWAAGLGGNSVKASTEHYVVMQEILSDQAFPDDPDAYYQLDNNLVLVGGADDGRYVADVIAERQALYDAGDTSLDVFPFAEGGVPAGDGVIDIRDVLTPNESTVTENIAVGNDYSVTLKDDGKLLYRWGQIVKRPNDIRMGIQVDLPDSWTAPGAELLNGGKGYRITGAELVVNHAITNNPNDQIRPEDLENEAATGRKPQYMEIEHPDHPGDSDYALWVATVDDFKGDGTFLPSYFVLDENGDLELDIDGNPIVNTDADGNPIGTIFREIAPDGYESKILTTSDLAGGFTDAWYTTMDRDPFEAVLDGNGDYIVGPRWRFKSNKFGQDLPGVEIPLIPHSEPPFQKDNIKYEVGELTTTTINLLDWAAGEDSPLLYSNGWVTANPDVVDSNGVTVNGLKLSDKFDVAFYVKGDAKPTQIYDAHIRLTYEVGTTFTVTTAADDGAGSLREAIELANALPGVDAIEFDIPGVGVQTIQPLSALPTITEGVILDATTQPGYSALAPTIAIDGSLAGTTDGLLVTSGQSVVRGLAIYGFAGDGIELRGGAGNVIENNFLGVDATGYFDEGNGVFGLHVNRSAGNTIQGNLISGNEHSGISIRGDQSTGNRIFQNRIGANVEGLGAIGNTYHGVVVVDGAHDNDIGAEGAGNQVGGNRSNGILLTGSTVSGNRLVGNSIGAAADGSSPLGNGTFGVFLSNSPDNLLDGNLISGNRLMGVALRGAETTGNSLTGNWIGTDITGQLALPNAVYGVYLGDSAADNQIGGSLATSGNVISANGHSGVALDTGARENQVAGNHIGLTADGTAGLGNTYHGVVLYTGATGNRIGGLEEGAGNFISDNGQAGIQASAGSFANFFEGNQIGTDESGEFGLGNGIYGVNVVRSPDNAIAGNRISGSGFHGVKLSGTATTRNQILDNLIGRVGSFEDVALSNALHGVLINDGAFGNQIGSSDPLQANTIAFNGAHGVAIGGNGVQNRVGINSFYANGVLGIDLGVDGVTANDAGDLDEGANRLQNTPQVMTAVLSGSMLNITYTVNTAVSAADYPIVVDFYLADSNGQEGRTYLGSDEFTAEDFAAGTKHVGLDVDLLSGERILATATDGGGLWNTSEFSAPRTVV